MKLYYYNAYVTFNGEKTNVPFEKILDQIAVLNPSQKFKETRHGEYSLIKMRLPIQNRDVTDRSVCFADYRARKPKIGERRSSRFEDIDDDVIESTNAFYQHSNKLFILEYNHYGAKAKQIEEYLTSFLPKTENNIWGIELIEIEAPIGLSDVLDSSDIRDIDIKLDVSSHQKKLLSQEEEPKSITHNIKLLKDIVAAQEELGGNIAQIHFGNGRKKDNLLDAEEVKKFLQVLDLESDLYISIRVKYYSNALSKINELDLKNVSVLKEETTVDGDAWETVADKIEEYFYDYGRTGENKHLQYEDEIIVKDTPNIIIPN